MKTIDIFNLSTRVLKTNRMRTALTIVGIGVGIGSILFLVSLGYGLQKVILERIANSDSLLSVDIVAGLSEELILDEKLIEKISKLDSVSEVSPLVSLNAQMETIDFSGGITANFVNGPYFRLSGMEISSGNFFKDNEKNNIVVSTAVLKLFNLVEEDIVEIDKNEEIKITIIIPKDDKNLADTQSRVEGEVEIMDLAESFNISGVVKNDNIPFIFLNLENIKDFNIKEYDQLKAKAKDKKSISSLKESIYDMGYSVTSISETIEQANKIFSVIQIILATFGVVALLVSAIGMFNTMTIALLQRTKEIGIMKSLGAKNRDIKKLFLTEAILIGFLGGIAGLGFGFGIEYIFNFLLNVLSRALGGAPLDIFYTPSWFIILIIFFSTIVGLLTGVWPARRASKLNPLDALRYK